VLSRSRLGATLFALAALSVAEAAHAQPAELQKARALFDEAGELELQGQWGAAQDRLRAALRIRETPHLRYALGWALENGGHLLEARTEYDLALRLARRDGAPDVSRIAAARVAEVERKIPLVQIRVRGALAKDTRVLVDGRDVLVGANGGTAQVDPGARVVRIERSGEAATELSFSIAQGALRVVDVRGDAGAGGSSGAGAEGGDSRGGAGTTLPWILVGGGGALALGGALLFVSSASDSGTRDDSTRKWCDATACADGVATRPETADAAAFRREAYDAASRGNTKQIAGALVGGAGLVSVAAGAYLLLTARDRVETRQASSRGVVLQAAPLQGGAMAGASLTF
jgi:hypothetical protein